MHVYIISLTIPLNVILVAVYFGRGHHFYQDLAKLRLDGRLIAVKTIRKHASGRIKDGRGRLIEVTV